MRPLLLLLTAGSAILTLATASCAVGPNFHTPAPPTVTAYTPTPLPDHTASAEAPGGDAQSFTLGADMPAHWWSLYQSPEIDALVRQAIKVNPDLAAAQAALRQAKDTLSAARGAYLPTADASFQGQRERSSAYLSPPLSTNQLTFNLFNAGVSIAYAPDVFGGVRRQVENAAALAQQQRFQTEATYLTLTANVVNAAVQIASLREQIAATQAIIAADQKALNITQQEKALGQLSGLDVSLADTTLRTAEATLPPLQKQLAQETDLLADLTGQFPAEAPAPALDLTALSLPHDLPVSLPSDLVQHRPDIQAAEANLHAASALVGVAIANRLPSFTLTAEGGGTATKLGQITNSAANFWTLAGGVTQPIFQGGTLYFRQKAAQAGYDQAKAQYRSTVLSAFQNVADALQAVTADAAALKTAVAAERAADQAFVIVKGQLALGEVNILTVLTAEQTYRQAEIALIQARAARFADTTALYQALGGGWWRHR